MTKTRCGATPVRSIIWRAPSVTMRALAREKPGWFQYCRILSTSTVRPSVASASTAAAMSSRYCRQEE
ncbi:hypothetical protein BJF81_09910 [Ornithinimicrobium sp. CNJ-824]|nr:hypothetical protein BJF81_09910 [Ornithinimicrobium sp. CNJ-824]